ncbi:hypothetical protein [Porphyromonas sp.]
MKRVLSILILGVALFSCSQRGPLGGQNKVNKEQQDTTKNNEGENNGGTDGPNTPPCDEYICSGHQINRYYKISALSIREDALKKDNHGNYVMTVEFVTNSFYGYRTPAAEVSKFVQCADKFGDNASKMTFPEAIDEGFALSAFVKNVTITTADDFDATHPAASSLSDIVEIEYLTAYPSIKRHYDPTNLEGLINPNVGHTDPRYGVQRIRKTLDKVSEEELAMVYLDAGNAVLDSQNPKNKNILYRMRFSKAPSNGVQTVTITLTTDEGVYTATKKVAFL